MTSYIVQTWKGTKRIHNDISGLSLDAAREIASTHMILFGYVGRIIAEQGDYMEVYDPKRGVRKGTYAETTLVRVPSEYNL